jgi:hypothetical protein
MGQGTGRNGDLLLLMPRWWESTTRRAKMGDSPKMRNSQPEIKCARFSVVHLDRNLKGSHHLTKLKPSNIPQKKKNTKTRKLASAVFRLITMSTRVNITREKQEKGRKKCKFQDMWVANQHELQSDTTLNYVN